MIDCTNSSAIRTFLCIENRLLRESLARLLRKRSEFTVVGQFSSFEHTPADLAEDQCDVLLGDSFLLGRLPMLFGHGGGLPGFRIILIGMSHNEEQFLTAVRFGVGGYLLQDASASDVLAAVRAVARGEAICPARLCSALFRFVAHSSKDLPLQASNPKPDLTLRQQQLISLVAKGLTNKEIASQLNLSEFTVRNHIARILKQVDAVSRSEAVANVRAQGYALVT